MKFMKSLSVVAASLALVAIMAAQDKGKGGGGKKGGFTLPPMIHLSISGFADGGTIPAKYVGGMGVSPAMTWTGAPANTAAYVLVMHDPDPVLAGKSAADDVLHWVIYDIPGDAKGLPEGIKPGDQADGAKQLVNITGQQSYLGPGPPAGHGAHHYTFEIYGLNAKLGIAPTSSRADLFNAMTGKVIAKGVYIGMFENK